MIPLRYGGLSIQDPNSNPLSEYDRSLRMSQPLLDGLSGSDLEIRIDLWPAGKIQYLLDEARYLQHTKDGKGNYHVEENWHKTFTRLILRGNIGGAVRTLDGKASFGKCLKLNEKVGQLIVKQALSEKHPHGVNLHEEGLIKHSMIGTPVSCHLIQSNNGSGYSIDGKEDDKCSRAIRCRRANMGTNADIV
ncbi:hypothetical protein GJ496_005857 [Pomphorhynchus laevis]|nr:hypothetical protein GJ496_005857 [Pomphorhynchus laevis]